VTVHPNEYVTKRSKGDLKMATLLRAGAAKTIEELGGPMGMNALGRAVST
jgi:hypothetical protein